MVQDMINSDDMNSIESTILNIFKKIVLSKNSVMENSQLILRFHRLFVITLSTSELFLKPLTLYKILFGKVKTNANISVYKRMYVLELKRSVPNVGL